MNSKEKQTNSEDANLDNDNFIEKQNDADYINEQTAEIKIEEQSIDIEEVYKFGWSSYSEITNGRFAMIGFLAIILICLLYTSDAADE